MKLKLKKEIIENKDLSHNAIVAYIGIVACMNQNFDYIFTNKNMINFYLTKTTQASKRFEENLRNGFSELFDKKIVQCYEKHCTDYYLEHTNIKLDQEDKFVFVDIKDIITIMTSKHQGRNGLLRFYICLLSSFLSKNHIQDVREPDKFNNVMGMMSQEYLATLAGISKSSAVEYIKTLEELKLIYVYRCSFMFRDKDGTIKKHNNIYGKYKDKEIIDDFAGIKYSMYDDLHKYQSEKAANSYRSLMQKYNFLYNGVKYDDKTVENIFKHVVNYNNKNPKKQKDLSIFKQYGYVID